MIYIIIFNNHSYSVLQYCGVNLTPVQVWFPQTNQWLSRKILTSDNAKPECD